MTFSNDSQLESVHRFECTHARAWRLVVTLLLLTSNISAKSQDAVPAKLFNEQVVAKADKILADVGLRRSGKTIITSTTSEVARNISNLSKTRRALKQLHDTWNQTSNQMAQMRQQTVQLNAQNFQLNRQLAQPGLDTPTNNQLVGSINANVAQMRQLTIDEERAKVKLAADRKAVNEAESAYAETVLALRRDLNSIKTKLEEDLKGEQIKIALQVCNSNFGTPNSISTDMLLASIEKRMKQIEQEIFSESIPLEVTKNGSLYVNVSVGDKTTRMVLDSGATVISLPAATATQLGIVVPDNAPKIKLILADGREIPGRGVTIAKVRIGQFEAENVEAAVLDAIAINAEPLLGMSFLGNFKFEIDTADKSLKLLRVNGE